MGHLKICFCLVFSVILFHESSLRRVSRGRKTSGTRAPTADTKWSKRAAETNSRGSNLFFVLNDVFGPYLATATNVGKPLGK